MSITSRFDKSEDCESDAESKGNTSKHAISKGKTLYSENQVFDVKPTSKNTFRGYVISETGAARGRDDYTVDVTIQGGQVVKHRCNCRGSGRWGMCKHRIAMLYYIKNHHLAKGGTKKNDMDEEIPEYEGEGEHTRGGRSRSRSISNAREADGIEEEEHPQHKGRAKKHKKVKSE